MIRRATVLGAIAALLALGFAVPAAAKPDPEPAPDPSADPTAVVPGPGTEAIVAELEGGGFGNGSKWGVNDDISSCVDNFDDDGLGIEDASLNGSDFDDNDDPGSFDDAFDNALLVYVDGEPIPDATPTTDDATFYDSGVTSLSGLDTSIEFRTFADQPALRELVTLTNPSGAPITVEVGWGGDTGADTPTSDGTGTTVVRSGNGDTTFQFADSFVTISDDGDADNDPITSYVLFGSGAALQPSGFDPDCGVFGDGTSTESNLGVLYDVTVPAGQTVYLMFFVAMDVDVVAATARADELVNLCATHAKVADLSESVRDATLNWDLSTTCPLTVLFTG